MRRNCPDDSVAWKSNVTPRSDLGIDKDQPINVIASVGGGCKAEADGSRLKVTVGICMQCCTRADEMHSVLR